MIIKITPDKERAKSILKMAENTESAIKSILAQLGVKNNPSIIAREYYEVIRELATGILLAEGIKIIGENAHKETINALSSYNELLEEEIILIQDLRIKRNKSSYEGKPIESSYIENKKQKLDSIIKKLKIILTKKLGAK